MSAKKVIVALDAAEREQLGALISKGKAPAKTVLKACILRKADTVDGSAGWRGAQIVEALNTNLRMVSRVREMFVMHGHDAVLQRQKRDTPPRPSIVDGEARAKLTEAQAKLTALGRSQPPHGHAG